MMPEPFLAMISMMSRGIIFLPCQSQQILSIMAIYSISSFAVCWEGWTAISYMWFHISWRNHVSHHTLQLIVVIWWKWGIGGEKIGGYFTLDNQAPKQWPAQKMQEFILRKIICYDSLLSLHYSTNLHTTHIPLIHIITFKLIIGLMCMFTVFA